MATKKRAEASPVRSLAAARIVERWARPGVEVPLDRIESELDGVARYDVVAALKELEKSGVGKFVVGRKGAKSRFVWDGDLQAASPERAAGRRTASTSAAPRVEEKGQPSLSGVARAPAVTASSPRTLEHAFYVRAGVLLKVQLPEDVTPQEIERVCQFLQAIPFR